MIAARGAVRRGCTSPRAGSQALVAPFPREHGAWVMLGAPILTVLVATPPSSILPPLLLLMATISAFGLQHVAGHLLRRRGAEEVSWAVAYLLVLIVASLLLLFVYHLHGLVPISLLAAAVFGIKIALSLSPSHRRFDRTVWGELLGTMALTLTGPAAYVVSRGVLDATAWRLWLLFVLFFASGVFFVNLLIAASRSRGFPDLRTRWRVGQGHLLYHAALAVTVGSIVARGGRPAVLLALAFAPMVTRAFLGWMRLSEPPPPLKRVGQRELYYALWFAACLAAWLRASLF